MTESPYHGNARKSPRPHHLYEIIDREYNDVYKYGICGRPLNKDGSSKRANTQVKEYNRLVGWARFFANVLLTGILGNKRAREIEDEYIDAYEREHGRKPRGNE